MNASMTRKSGRVVAISEWSPLQDLLYFGLGLGLGLGLALGSTTKDCFCWHQGQGVAKVWSRCGR